MTKFHELPEQPSKSFLNLSEQKIKNYLVTNFSVFFFIL